MSASLNPTKFFSSRVRGISGGSLFVEDRMASFELEGAGIFSGAGEGSLGGLSGSREPEGPVGVFSG